LDNRALFFYILFFPLTLHAPVSPLPPPRETSSKGDFGFSTPPSDDSTGLTSPVPFGFPIFFFSSSLSSFVPTSEVFLAVCPHDSTLFATLSHFAQPTTLPPLLSPFSFLVQFPLASFYSMSFSFFSPAPGLSALCYSYYFSLLFRVIFYICSPGQQYNAFLSFIFFLCFFVIFSCITPDVPLFPVFFFFLFSLY